MADHPPSAPPPPSQPRPAPPDLAGLYCTDCSVCFAEASSPGPGGAIRPVGIAAETVLVPGNPWFKRRPRGYPDHCELCHHPADDHKVGLHNAALSVRHPLRPFSDVPDDAMVFRHCRCVIADDAPELAVDRFFHLAFVADGVRVSPAGSARSIVRRPLADVIGVSATGDGARTTDAGAMGFGSSISGIAAATAISSAFNAISTNVTIECFIHVALRASPTPAEWVFATTAFEPDVVARALHTFNRAAAGVAPPAPDAGPGLDNAADDETEPSKVDQLHKLAELRETGVVTDVEFESLKREILEGD